MPQCAKLPLFEDEAAVGTVERGRSLAPLTRYRLGGPAEWFVRPSSLSQLTELVARCRQEDVACRILGGGANLLVDDDGVNGAVVRLDELFFTAVEWDVRASLGVARQSTSVLVRAGAGVDMGKLVLESVQRGLSGLECMTGIPGSLGGTIRMNAGGRWGEIANVVREVSVIEPGRGLRVLAPEQVGFDYRHTALGDAIVCGATLELTPADPVEVRRSYDEVLEAKVNSQPLAAHTAGCVFKNPPGEKAGRLIDAAGLKGRRIGTASVSPAHANFIVADKGGRARDVLDLIALVRQTVAERFGVNLELEIEVWRRS